MRIQKFLALGAVSVLTLSLLSIPAFAHGGHHGYSAHQNSACSVCHAENHSEACYSIHNDTLYCGLGHAGGVCDGSCRPLCTIEICTSTGQHSHNGVLYCGYDHAEGYCNGSCIVATQVSSAASHHGHGHGHGHCHG